MNYLYSMLMLGFLGFFLQGEPIKKDAAAESQALTDLYEACCGVENPVEYNWTVMRYLSRMVGNAFG